MKTAEKVTLPDAVQNAIDFLSQVVSDPMLRGTDDAAVGIDAAKAILNHYECQIRESQLARCPQCGELLSK